MLATSSVATHSAHCGEDSSAREVSWLGARLHAWSVTEPVASHGYMASVARESPYMRAELIGIGEGG